MSKLFAPFRITIDDLGFFSEMDLAFLELERFQQKIYCSWVTNYFPPSKAAVNSLYLKNGLHFNLIEGKSHTKNRMLSDENGFFNLRWLDFLWPQKELRIAVEAELNEQIQKSIEWFGKLSHMDSHLHLHSIPWIHTLLRKKQIEYGIEFLRNPSQKISEDLSCLTKPTSLIKIILLNSLSSLSQEKDFPCLGITRLFEMNLKFCLEKNSLMAERELVWHAAAFPKNIEKSDYRFISEQQLILRAKELEELTAYLERSSR